MTVRKVVDEAVLRTNACQIHQATPFSQHLTTSTWLSAYISVVSRYHLSKHAGVKLMSQVMCPVLSNEVEALNAWISFIRQDACFVRVRANGYVSQNKAKDCERMFWTYHTNERTSVKLVQTMPRNKRYFSSFFLLLYDFTWLSWLWKRCGDQVTVYMKMQQAEFQTEVEIVGCNRMLKPVLWQSLIIVRAWWTRGHSCRVESPGNANFQGALYMIVISGAMKTMHKNSIHDLSQQPSHIQARTLVSWVQISSVPHYWHCFLQQGSAKWENVCLVIS